MTTQLREALAACHRDRLTALRLDAEAAAWGGLRHEAALAVLGEAATASAIASLLELSCEKGAA